VSLNKHFAVSAIQSLSLTASLEKNNKRCIVSLSLPVLSRYTYIVMFILSALEIKFISLYLNWQKAICNISSFLEYCTEEY
jgi:hypothetical protein